MVSRIRILHWHEHSKAFVWLFSSDRGGVQDIFFRWNRRQNWMWSCEEQGHHHKKMREETRNLDTFGRIEVRTFLDFRTTDWQPTLCPFSLTYVSVSTCSPVFGFHHTNATQSSPSTNLFVFVHMGGKCLAYSVVRRWLIVSQTFEYSTISKVMPILKPILLVIE